MSLGDIFSVGDSVVVTYPFSPGCGLIGMVESIDDLVHVYIPDLSPPHNKHRLFSVAGSLVKVANGHAPGNRHIGQELPP